MNKWKKIWQRVMGAKIAFPVPLLALVLLGFGAGTVVLASRLSRALSGIDEIRRRTEALELQMEELAVEAPEDSHEGCYDEEDPQFLDIRFGI